MARAGGITNAVNVGIAMQADWENREFISKLSLNNLQRKIKLAKLNEKMDTLERHLEMLELQVSNATADPGLFTPN